MTDTISSAPLRAERLAVQWATARAVGSLLLSMGLLGPAQAQMAPGTKPAAKAAAPEAKRKGDYILAVVGSELVTAAELELAMARLRDDAQQTGRPLPPLLEMRQKVLDSLINDRVLLSYAKRDYNIRIDDAEVDRAVANVAAQNRLTVAELSQRLADEGMDFKRYREQIRDQLVVERVREVEVRKSVVVTDADIDAHIAKQTQDTLAWAQFNVAHIAVALAPNATPAEVNARRAKVDEVLRRLQAGESFEALAKSMSDDRATAVNGGKIGLRGLAQMPDWLSRPVKSMQVGQVSDAVVRSPAGFHVIKLLERVDQPAFSFTQTRARHILIRPDEKQVTSAAVEAQMQAMRHDILSGTVKFEDLAKRFSQDGSAPQGGDLGWASPGMFVPEFEQVMNALPINGVSEPTRSQFGFHLIQVLERRVAQPEPRQLREQVRSSLREKKFEEENEKWVKQMRAQAFIEMRESPQ
jgi:peptidyl-prolyl cis-trans isomerase SurA